MYSCTAAVLVVPVIQLMLSDCTYGCTLYTVQSAITYGTVQLYYTAQNSSYYSVQLYSTAVR